MAKSKVATRKRDLDYKVACSLGVSRKTVSAVTSLFIQEIINTVLEEGAVHVDSLGAFRLKVYKPTVTTRRLSKGYFKKGQKGGTILVKVPHLTRVLFTRTTTFKRLIREQLREQERGRHGKIRR